MLISKERHTARALIVTHEHDLLLLSVSLPWMQGETWTLPGGGIEAGETADETARREIYEEVGFTYEGNLDQYWHTTIEFRYKGEIHRTHEQYFLARIDEKFEPSMANMMDYEKDFSLELKWWSAAELSATTAFFSPKQIPNMAETVATQCLPIESNLLRAPLPENYLPNL